MKHLPFDSIYKPDFEVVEQRQGKFRLYPHTDQLPVLYRAINLHFRSGLPPRLIKVGNRATGFDKVVLKHCSLFFCHWINGARKDEVRLYSLMGRDLIARPSIVQQITEDHRLGRSHRFRFYAGEDFFPEIFLCGKRVVFADHVLERYSSRAEVYKGEDFSTFLLTFFNGVILSMPVGPGRAFVTDNLGSIVALPYKETESEYFVTSCLTINEITSMLPELPPFSINAHYDLPFRRPKLRNWIPVSFTVAYFNAWDRKTLPKKVEPRGETLPSWYEIAYFARDQKKKDGHGPGSELYFMDGIPGPMTFEAKPGKSFYQYDELANFKQTNPDYDWEHIFAEREKEGTYPPA